MLLSGSKSYYDDFVRKKDMSQTLHDPPSLLTDRGAYMNFLEVQLERVSAACLGVQAYDDRFNDMQNLIVSLDKKCASTARLVSIAQQCTEQLRNDFDGKLEKLTQEIRSESWETKRMMEVMSTRIAAVELKAAELPVVHKRLDDNDTRSKSIIQDIQNLSEETDSKVNLLEAQVADFDKSQQSMLQDVEDLRTSDSKLQFDLKESERKYHSLLENAIAEQSEKFAEVEDKSSRNLHMAVAKLNGDMEALHVDMAAKESGCLAAVRLLGESLREETLKIKEKLESHMTGVGEELNNSVENQMKRLNRSLADQVDVINEEIEHQKRKITSLNENNRVQFKQLDRVIGSLSRDQGELHHFNYSAVDSSIIGASEENSIAARNKKINLDEVGKASSRKIVQDAAQTQKRALIDLVEGKHTLPQKSEHRANTPTTPASMFLSSLNETEVEDSDRLRYIGGGLYVDGERETSPILQAENAKIDRKESENLHNNEISAIKPSHQRISPLSVPSAKNTSQAPSNQTYVAAVGSRINNQVVSSTEQDNSNRHVINQVHHNRREVHQISNEGGHTGTPKKRRPPAPPKLSNTVGSSSTGQAINTTHKTPTNSDVASSKPLQVSAPATVGFANFIKNKVGQSSDQQTDGSEKNWRDILLEEAAHNHAEVVGRPPWMPSGNTTATSTIRHVEHRTTDAQGESSTDDRTAASTITDINPSHAGQQNFDKTLPERRHYEYSTHLKGSSAHL